MTKDDSAKDDSVKDDSAKPGKSGRARPGPTIDLKAKEISNAATSPDKTKAEDGEARMEAAQARAEDSSSSPPPGGGSRRSPIRLMPLLVAVIAGLPLFGLGWWFGDNVSGSARPQVPAAPAAASPSPEVIARLDEVEAALAKRSAADPTVRAMADNIAALQRRIDDIVRTANEARSRAAAAASSAEAAQREASPAGIAQADLEDLSKRIAALEQATTNKDSALSDRISGEAEDRAGRLAIVASILRNAVERGEPYVSELVAAKNLSPDDASLAPLESFAAGGIPSERALARELSSLAQRMIKLVDEPAPPSGMLEKLQASAERLIRIRPVGDIPGDDPAAVISRVELKATRTDIEGALGELAKLPPKIRAPAEDWIRKARGREAAVAASRQFAHDAVAALGKPGL